MTLAAQVLTTLGVVKDELGVVGSTDDAKLERYITAASARVESFCNRSFFQELGRVDKVPGFGSFFLLVPKTPIVGAITSILDDTTVVPVEDYEVDDPKAGKIRNQRGWRWTVGHQRNFIEIEPLPGSEKSLFTITYDGGFVTPQQVVIDQALSIPVGLVRTLPDDLEDAVIQLVTLRYRKRGIDPSIKSTKTLSHSGSYAGVESSANKDSGGFPDSIAAMILPFRRLAQA